MIKRGSAQLEQGSGCGPAYETPVDAVSPGLVLGFQVQQSPMPSGEVLDGLARHIPDVGERWMQLFEAQVHHDHDLATEAFRADRQVNDELIKIQADSLRLEQKRIIIAQVVAGSLLLLGMLFFAALVVATLWFFKKDKTAAGTVSLALAGAFGYFFRGVLHTYFPARHGQA